MMSKPDIALAFIFPLFIGFLVATAYSTGFDNGRLSEINKSTLNHVSSQP